MAINSYYPVPELEEYAERFKEFFKFFLSGRFFLKQIVQNL